MPLPPRGQASYKKQDGILAISKDRKAVSWSPAQPPDASPKLVIIATNITNLQQTPESSAKVMLKIFAQEDGQTDPVSHVFQFTSSTDAREEANAIKENLTSVIQAHKAAQTAPDSAGGHSAAMAMASTVSGGSKASNLWEDDERLKSDVKLQQSLMQEDALLRKTFLDSVKEKPDSISVTQFTAQFWSSRVPQLRAHAIAQQQGRGRYNVFSELRREEGGTKMNLTAEHVRVIFDQYPVMRLIYDELVPGKIKSDIDFWSRFFQSQLFMTLCGLKFDRSKEAKDSLLDRYLDHPELTGARMTSAELHIPKFIDLEGNEEHHSQRQGNRPNNELRASTLNNAPIIKRLNALSEGIMKNVRPSDVDASAPIGMDEAEYEQLRLRDLAGDPEQNRIILNIRDQSRFFADNRTSEDDESSRIRSIDPNKALQMVYKDLNSSFSRPGAGIIPIDEYESELEEDDDDESQADSGTGRATNHILSLIQANRDQTAPIPESSGLSTEIYERITLTHATTLEFLRQFWNAFLSGDAARATEIVSLAESLGRALDRVQSIVNDAEDERVNIIKTQQKKADELFKVSGKRQVVNVKAIGGGAEVVKQLLGPLVKSVQTAQLKFKAAYDEQIQQANNEQA